MAMLRRRYVRQGQKVHFSSSDSALTLSGTRFRRFQTLRRCGLDCCQVGFFVVLQIEPIPVTQQI